MNFKAWLLAERGRTYRLAKALGISQTAVACWVTVPVERLQQVSEFTGIPAEELRPDLARIFKKSA